MLRSLTQKIAPLMRLNLSNITQTSSAIRNFHLLSLPAVNNIQNVCCTNQLTNTPIKIGLLSAITPLMQQLAGFKVKGRLRRRCKDCYFVMRQERLYVICKTHPRHKQMAMKKRDYKSWILTHATQSKVRPY